MAWDALVHREVWRELPTAVHPEARAAVDELAAMAHPEFHPAVKPLRESRYPKSHRLRLGRFRLRFIVLPDERAIVFTTAFLERRKEDYHHAVRVHDARVKAYE